MTIGKLWLVTTSTNSRNVSLEYSQFSPITLYVKRNIRRLRMNAVYSMNEAARLLGVSQNRSLSKKLEDIEVIRNYGSHLDLELLAQIKMIYKTPLDDLIGDLLNDYYSVYCIRPRRLRPKSM